MPFSGLAGPTLTASWVQLSESAYDAGLEQPLHGHGPAYFTAVLSGRYRERIGRAERYVEAGELLYHPSGEAHVVWFTAAKTLVFRVQPLAPMLEAQRLSRAHFGTRIRQEWEARRIVAGMRTAYASGDALARLTIDGLACELVAYYGAAGMNRSAVGYAAAMRARELLESSLERTPSLRELSAETGCHPMTLTRAFRRAFGTSIGSYVRRRRLEEAARLLRHTNIPISIVAIKSGFADQAHLTRSLRRASGHTPAVLRALRVR